MNTILPIEMEATIAAHNFTEQRWPFRSRLVCSCGYQSPKYWRSTFWPTMRAHVQAYHWLSTIYQGGPG